MHKWLSLPQVKWQCKSHVVLYQRMTGLHFWTSGYCVSTVGFDERQIHQHVREPERLESDHGDSGFK